MLSATQAQRAAVRENAESAYGMARRLCRKPARVGRRASRHLHGAATSTPSSDNASRSPAAPLAVILRHAFIPPDNARLAHLCGSLDEHLRDIEAAFDVKIRAATSRSRRGREGRTPSARSRCCSAVRPRRAADRAPRSSQLALVEAMRATRRRATARRARGRRRRAGERRRPAPAHAPRRPGRPHAEPGRSYLRNILGHDITFGIGPAGTGKTFLAVACAVDALERSAVQRIILTRPAVEAGERLGFLPGDLAQKVDPYLRPLYDALYDLMGLERVGKAFEKGTLEIAPLAFMRGRTLNHAFVILDEAQNTTPEQMKMFLTRIGFGSQGGRHRRRQPDRPAASGTDSGPDRRRARAAPRARHRDDALHRRPTWCAIRWSRASSRPTTRRGADAPLSAPARRGLRSRLSLQFADATPPRAAAAPPGRALDARRARRAGRDHGARRRRRRRPAR